MWESLKIIVKYKWKWDGRSGPGVTWCPPNSEGPQARDGELFSGPEGQVVIHFILRWQNLSTLPGTFQEVAESPERKT